MTEAREHARATAAHQMAMARNIAHLKTKQSKQAQVRRLCESLKQSIRSK
jgi:hypothetical protein